MLLAMGVPPQFGALCVTAGCDDNPVCAKPDHPRAAIAEKFCQAKYLESLAERCGGHLTHRESLRIDEPDVHRAGAQDHLLGALDQRIAGGLNSIGEIGCDDHQLHSKHDHQQPHDQTVGDGVDHHRGDQRAAPLAHQRHAQSQ